MHVFSILFYRLKYDFMKFKFLGLACLIFIMGACKQSSPTETQSETASFPSFQISGKGRKASCVYLTKDEHSTPIISWVEIDTASREKAFYFAKMNTGDEKFGQPVSVPIPQNTSIHEEGMPKIAVKADGTLLALFETSEPLEGSKWGLGDVRYMQSFDKGKTWTEPRSVSPEDYAAQRSSSFSGLTRLSNGQIGMAWLGTHKDPSKEGRPVKFAKTIGRDSLSSPIVLDRKACECCRIAMAGNAGGGLLCGVCREVGRCIDCW